MSSVALPEYRQLDGLVDFLATALRGDRYLAKYLHGPSGVVGSTLQHDPFEPQPNGQWHMRLADTGLPALAIYDLGSTAIRDGAVHGDRIQLGLMYLFRPHLPAVGISMEDWGIRVSRAVWWQLRYYLRRRRVDGQRFDSDGNTIDHLRDAGIRSVMPTGDMEPLSGKEYSGFMARLAMVTYSPPFAVDAPQTLRKIDYEYHDDTVIPAVNGPITEGDITGA